MPWSKQKIYSECHVCLQGRRENCLSPSLYPFQRCLESCEIHQISIHLFFGRKSFRRPPPRKRKDNWQQILWSESKGAQSPPNAKFLPRKMLALLKGLMKTTRNHEPLVIHESKAGDFSGETCETLPVDWWIDGVWYRSLDLGHVVLVKGRGIHSKDETRNVCETWCEQ